MSERGCASQSVGAPTDVRVLRIANEDELVWKWI